MGKAAHVAAGLWCALGACACACAPAASAQSAAGTSPPRSAVVIVLDASSAMRANRLKDARQAILTAARGLEPGTPLGVRVYGGGTAKGKPACGSTRPAAPVANAKPAALKAALAKLRPAGASPVSRAIAQAARDLPTGSDGSVVVLAGAADNCASQPACTATGSAGGGAPVDVIGIEVSAAARRSLGCLARASGGVYQDALTPADIEPELAAALGRATRDRRPLGVPLAGGLEEQQATPARPGQYVDSIAPDTERWYSIDVPSGETLSIAATLVAPPAGDFGAPGSSLTLDGSGARSFTAPAQSNLFAFQPDRSVSVATQPPLPPGHYGVRVELHDSPDKQLAHDLGGRSLPLELAFDVSSRAQPRERVAATRPRPAHDVSWAAAGAAAAGCALILLAAVALAPRRKAQEPR